MYFIYMYFIYIYIFFLQVTEMKQYSPNYLLSLLDRVFGIGKPKSNDYQHQLADYYHLLTVIGFEQCRF